MLSPVQTVDQTGAVVWIAIVVLVESISLTTAQSSLRLPAVPIRPSAGSLTVEPLSIQQVDRYTFHVKKG